MNTLPAEIKDIICSMLDIVSLCKVNQVSKCWHSLSSKYINNYVKFKGDWHELVQWKGPYTVGHISLRGTRVWFRSSGALAFDSESLIDVENCKETIKDLDSNEVIFPGDYYNLRSESLEYIIDELKGKVEYPDICAYVSNIYNDPIFSTIMVLDKLEKQTDPIIIDLLPTTKLWILRRKDDIINELLYVFNICNKHGVEWRWV